MSSETDDEQILAIKLALPVLEARFIEQVKNLKVERRGGKGSQETFNSFFKSVKDFAPQFPKLSADYTEKRNAELFHEQVG
eukprot:6325896-Pyramimonas_sp.AAC.1